MKENLKKFIKESVVYRESNPIELVVLIASIATVYIRDSDSKETRENILEAINLYKTYFKQYLKWQQNPKTHQWRPTSDDIPELADVFPQITPMHEWEFGYHGGETLLSASEYFLQGFGMPKWQGGDGYLRMACPVDFMLDSSEEYISFIKRLCNILRPQHGYAGFGIMESIAHDVQQYYQPQVWQLAQRMSGLEVDIPSSHILHLKNKIKGVNWITILNDGYVDQVYSLNQLENEPSIRLINFNDGIIIVAGQYPVLGESLGATPPRDYALVAQSLKTIRATDLASFHYAGEGRMHEAEVRRWLARFD
ncbi:MAG: DUF3396 domain-containing protein [Anaerolineales bacterium]|nr:DUF3396 domain-containing protein [Anaerolineales bacterium]